MKKLAYITLTLIFICVMYLNIAQMKETTFKSVVCFLSLVTFLLSCYLENKSFAEQKQAKKKI